MKIILNKCFGGFDVSPQGYELYAKKKGLELYKYKDNLDFRNCEYIKLKDEENELFKHYFTKDFGEITKISEEDYEKYNLYLREESRQDQTLIEVVEELGEKASGRFGNLEVVEIPDNSFYKIDEYDGLETIYYSATEINIK